MQSLVISSVRNVQHFSEVLQINSYTGGERCYVFIPYTILFSSRLPTTLTALYHESLLIAASFVPDLNNLFIEACVQCNTSCAGSRFRGHRAVPSDLHGFGASLGKGSTWSFVLFLGRKKGFVPEKAMSMRGLSTDPHRPLSATARNGGSSLRAPLCHRQERHLP